MNTTEALKVFGIPNVIPIEELKVAFRKLVQSVHPDKGGTKEEFVAVKEAYDVLKEAAEESIVYGADKFGARTEEGTLISDLGHGHGEHTIQRACGNCYGHGYITKRTYERVLGYPECNACFGSGIYWIGFYPRVCRKCGGTGEYRKGRKVWKDGQPHDKFYVCTTCEGKGRIRIGTPVLRMGTMKQRNRTQSGRLKEPDNNT